MDRISGQVESTPQNHSDAEAKRQEEDEIRRDLMSRVLDPAARERLSRIALVSPERSKQIESILLKMAQSGQLRGRVTENQLIELLEQMEQSQGRKAGSGGSGIVYQRRKDVDDDLDLDI